MLLLSDGDHAGRLSTCATVIKYAKNVSNANAQSIDPT